MIRYLSASKIRCFKECRRKYWFRYIESLEPIVKAVPLALGKAVHTGLEIIDRGGHIEQAETAINLQYKDWPEEDTGIIPAHALAIVSGYNTCAALDWETIDMESRFEVHCGKGRRLVGYFDGIIKRNGHRYILERKTARTVDEKYLHNLLWDEQASIYAFAASELGLEVSGILYDIIQKASISRLMATPKDDRKYYAESAANRKLNRVGKMYENQRENDEPDEAYIERLQECYKEPERYTRHLVTRNKAQLESLSEDVRAVALDITVTEREERWYRNPSACQIFGCPYRSLCLEDTPEARTEFITKEEKRVSSEGQNQTSG